MSNPKNPKNPTAKRHSSVTSVIVVARHGERLDYCLRDRGENWLVTADRPYDTPLTEHGLEQGERLGRQINMELTKHGLPALTEIYASPFLRCRQTALAAWRGMEKGTTTSSVKIKVEMGLAESFNQPWYRSWALPGSDGTWGFRPANGSSLSAVEVSTLHPAAKRPVQSLLDWQSTLSRLPKEDELRTAFDLLYESQTTITVPYRLYPKLILESKAEQRRRMKNVVDRVAQPGQTVLLVSHGGPVTHLYEELTGECWKKHGESSYCCYSIYVREELEEESTTTTAASAVKDTSTMTLSSPSPPPWKALVVNQAQYLSESSIVTERHV